MPRKVCFRPVSPCPWKLTPADINRQRAIDHPLSLTPLIAALGDPETRVIAAVVLLNVCSDYGSTPQLTLNTPLPRLTG